MKFKNSENRWIWMGIFFLAIMATGCAGMKTKSDNTVQQPATGQAQMQTESQPLYYDFSDVLIPAELAFQKNLSFVMQTPGMTAGVLSFKGRVDQGSLIAFFQNSMARDNWRAVSLFKSPRTMMVFKKANRLCVINITDGNYTTTVEVWVAPTMAESMSSVQQMQVGETMQMEGSAGEQLEDAGTGQIEESGLLK
jgi:hypothetical protein